VFTVMQKHRCCASLFTQESKMGERLRIAICVTLFAAAGIATGASAQEKTRAEVRQELIQAENNGLRFVTDTSYPDVNPLFEQQVARLRQQSDSGGAPATAGSSETGKAANGEGVADSSACVGPISFCKLYFGN
jgi:hypothetical protein